MQTMPQLLSKILDCVEEQKGLGGSPDVLCLTKEDERTLAVEIWRLKIAKEIEIFSDMSPPDARAEVGNVFAGMLVQWDASVTHVRRFNEKELRGMGGTAAARQRQAAALMELTDDEKAALESVYGTPSFNLENVRDAIASGRPNCQLPMCLVVDLCGIVHLLTLTDELIHSKTIAVRAQALDHESLIGPAVARNDAYVRKFYRLLSRGWAWHLHSGDLNVFVRKDEDF